MTSSPQVAAQAPEAAAPAVPRHPWHYGPLYALIFNAFPEYRTKTGLLDRLALCGATGCSQSTLSKAFNEDFINNTSASRLWTHSSDLEEAGDRQTNGVAPAPLTQENLTPFLFRVDRPGMKDKGE